MHVHDLHPPTGARHIKTLLHAMSELDRGLTEKLVRYAIKREAGPISGLTKMSKKKATAGPTTNNEQQQRDVSFVGSSWHLLTSGFLESH